LDSLSLYHQSHFNLQNIITALKRLYLLQWFKPSCNGNSAKDKELPSMKTTSLYSAPPPP
ncbi:hypothetical protein BgiBS90_013063, partial [Biomphalaria glabrata]